MSLKTEKEQDSENAGAQKMEDELEESETEALAEDDPAELQEGVPMQDVSEIIKSNRTSRESWSQRTECLRARGTL